MDTHDSEINAVRRQLRVDRACAEDVVYLRTRNRWSPELEAELIRLHRVGTPPDMNRFGVTPETQAALLREAMSILKAGGS
jgi:hypothetical protein